MAPQEVQMPFTEVQYVVCADTMGLEKEIPENVRKQLAEYVQLLKKGWEKKESQRIKADVENQIKYVQLFEGSIQETVQKLM